MHRAGLRACQRQGLGPIMLVAAVVVLLGAVVLLVALVAGDRRR